MHIEAKDLIVPLISLIGMIIPIGLLGWKFSRIVWQVEMNKVKSEAVEKTVKAFEDRLMELGYTSKQMEKDLNGIGCRLNRTIEGFEKKMTEISGDVGHISDVLGRIETRMATMIEAQAEIKKQIIPREVIARALKEREAK